MDQPSDAETSMLSQLKEKSVDVAGAVDYFEQRIDILERNITVQIHALMESMTEGFKKLGVNVEVENLDGDG